MPLTKPILLNRGRGRKSRPKTFSSEDAAKKYADANSIKSYKLVNLKVNPSSKPKIKIVAD